MCEFHPGQIAYQARFLPSRFLDLPIFLTTQITSAQFIRMCTRTGTIKVVELTTVRLRELGVGKSNICLQIEKVNLSVNQSVSQQISNQSADQSTSQC